MADPAAVATETWKMFLRILWRKRTFSEAELRSNRLVRALRKWDLRALGLGSPLSIGVYVLVGSLAMRTAGPSIVLSFVFAAIAAMLAALCHAEFGSRAPRAGSAFTFIHLTVGPLAAFIVGWSMLLEGVFGAATIAKGLSTYIDTLFLGVIGEWFTGTIPVKPESTVFSDFFDVIAFLLIIIFGIKLVMGMKESVTINNAITIMNFTIIIFIVICGSIHADPRNWRIPPNRVPSHNGDGGFFPYGIWGTVKATAICFYGFVGFEVISTATDQVKNPAKQIPIVIFIVLVIITVVYVSIAIVITMMVPYYDLDKVAAVASAFEYVEWTWAAWIVGIGAVIGILGGLFAFMYHVTRLMYTMASDGLFLHYFKYVGKRRTPIYATVFVTVVAALNASILDLDHLILIMCLGTLLAYTTVAICVLILRYRSFHMPEPKPSYWSQSVGRGLRIPSHYSARITHVCILLFILICITSAMIWCYYEYYIAPVVILHIVLLGMVAIIGVQPQVQEPIYFKTPLVPFVPCLSIYANVNMMVMVDGVTWARFVVWVVVGLPIYYLCLYFYKQPSSNASDEPPASPRNTQLKTQTSSGGVKTASFAQMPDLESSPHSPPIPPSHRKYLDSQIDMRQPSGGLQETEIIVQQAIVENNAEKEAKIIDLLDQVLQAEEDSYVELESLKEEDKSVKDIMIPINEPSIPHRKSISDLSDAGSDASLGNQELSKYSVIAQVHREDLPKLSELEERIEKEDDISNEVINNDHDEQITSFNESETNSRTDESGYSDTIDRNVFNDSIEDTTDIPHIPTPPPLDENFFKTPFVFQKSFFIPRPNTQKQKSVDGEEENKPRESVQSNNSQDDGNIVFGSNKQIKFMNKLNNLFQNKMATEDSGEEQRKRSNSTGAVVDTPEITLMRERPSMFMDLKKELLSMHSTPSLRPVNVKDKENTDTNKLEAGDAKEDTSLSREDLKSKLESIFASGVPNPMKPRIIKSNNPTPEESYQSDLSSTESIAKLPKIEKNDTLKRQKDKFGEVLNSFRLSLNRDDAV